MKFQYRKLLLPSKDDFFGSAILKPIIPIQIKIKNDELDYVALIDSGADFCIFDAELGEYLGLDVRFGREKIFGGVQERGGATAFLHDVILSVGGWDYKTTVGFSYDIAERGFGVLGQKGFFDIFTVKFDILKEEIELKERDLL
ncbi:hypothetical protein A2755_02105 [Candidatus Wolfebacteria bacterium RIFCSPHIGHO2_01_FULL_48_22]|uniref:Peptidase A2 domain-containing protein n=2 Tax=Candidatus Wolfeibacteriota TaxID=1752735 RepID=A0A1F8DTN5_9BACT|nr:MAG: hypothetical protein A2755_02105 [Candidatus Wolfebacteria bacterium RIFCSPHIGHO2_01_FULL_48_22]OGM92323.1 MAG: hypothetical protein A2935_00965 [Candidatus Wolfebacteria bacterium RIFCSPLOWO2_01_FULL_47_17b]